MSAITHAAVESSSSIEPLLDLAASATGARRDFVARLAETLLALPAADAGPRGGRSGLNYDQTPMQLCFSIGPEGVHARLLADPALELADSTQRYEASYAAMTHAIDLAQSPEMRELCNRTLDANLPEGELEPGDYPDGILWLAAGVDTPGLAMYVDARRGGDAAAWPRLREWFAAMLPDMRDANLALDALRSQARLMCLGVEGMNVAGARAKLYWRLASPAPLSAIGIERFSDARFERFLALAMRNREIRLSGIVPSIGFKIQSGALSDVKIDVCACRACLDWSPSDWTAILSDLGREFGFAAVPIEEWLRHGEMAFIGFGLDQRGTARLNIYLKPFNRSVS